MTKRLLPILLAIIMPTLAMGPWGHTIQLIYADSVNDVAITGLGTIDGRGAAFPKLSWNDEFSNVEVMTETPDERPLFVEVDVE